LHLRRLVLLAPGIPTGPQGCRKNQDDQQFAAPKVGLHHIVIKGIPKEAHPM
jgi:hypothetical protein